MRGTVPTVIVGANILLREELIAALRPLGYRVAASKASISEIGPEDFPPSDPSLLIVECSDGSQRLIPHLVAVRQQTPLVRIALLGHDWRPSEIAAAFIAGANAYFAKATASDEFVSTVDLIMRGRESGLPGELLPGQSDIEHDNRSRA